MQGVQTRTIAHVNQTSITPYRVYRCYNKRVKQIQIEVNAMAKVLGFQAGFWGIGWMMGYSPMWTVKAILEMLA